MANGRSPGRRSGTGGFSGSGRSSRGRANRGGSGKGGGSRSTTREWTGSTIDITSSPLSSPREALSKSKGSEGRSSATGNTKQVAPGVQAQTTPLYATVTVTESGIQEYELPGIEIVAYLNDDEEEEKESP